MSSGLTGWGSGMMDFFSVSLDKAFLISATGNKKKKNSAVLVLQRPLLLSWTNAGDETTTQAQHGIIRTFTRDSRLNGSSREQNKRG